MIDEEDAVVPGTTAVDPDGVVPGTIGVVPGVTPVDPAGVVVVPGGSGPPRGQKKNRTRANTRTMISERAARALTMNHSLDEAGE